MQEVVLQVLKIHFKPIKRTAMWLGVFPAGEGLYAKEGKNDGG